VKAKHLVSSGTVMSVTVYRFVEGLPGGLKRLLIVMVVVMMVVVVRVVVVMMVAVVRCGWAGGAGRECANNT
jgi:uncharacterized membrane protein